MNDVGTVDGQLEGDDRPGRVTGDMGATDAEVAEQRRGVGRMLREAHRRRAVAAGLSPLVVPDQAVALDQRLSPSKNGRKLSAMGPVLISSTGSPDPLTSYSNSTPLTFAFSMTHLHIGLSCWRLIRSSSTPTALTPMRDEGGYGGNFCCYNGGGPARRRGVEDEHCTPTTLVDQARDAVARGEWQQAHDLLIEADARTPLSGPDLALLAEVAYAAGHLDVTIAAWERAYAQSVRAGDHLAAAGAAVRVALHLLFDTALMAPVRGWIRRAERLLEGQDETPVHAWLAVVRNYERLLSGDFQSARHWARRAIEVGTKCDPAAAAIGRVAEARSLILEGEVPQGLGLLNEAAVATVSGELDPLSTGIVYCELVCALQALAQYDLAEEWTEAMERWRHGQPVGSIHGRCRVHRAEILRLRGSCGEAEQEALAGLRGAAPLPAPGVRVAVDRARPHPAAPGRHPGRGGGIPRGARGRVGPAARPRPGASGPGRRRPGGRSPSATRSTHPLNVPSKELPPNTELRRAPLLEAQVEIEVAAGNLELARAAADELSRIAALFESKALAASAALARGQGGAGRRRHGGRPP